MRKLSLGMLKLGSGEMLERNQLSLIYGGNGSGIDGNPSGPSGGSGYESKTYKCCWDSYPDTCSDCVNCSSTCTCVPQATLKEC